MENELSRFYLALGHPLRRKIIQVLGEEEKATFTKLKSSLNVSTGTIYYNIGLLADLINQRDDRSYALTSKGGLAYHLLQESEEKLLSSPHSRKEAGLLRHIGVGLVGWRFLPTFLVFPKLAIAPALMIWGYGMWVNYQAQLYPIIFFFHTKPPVMVPVAGAALFAAGLTIVNVIGNLIPWLFFNKKEKALSLFVGTSVAILPTLILPTVWVISKIAAIQISSLLAQTLVIMSMGYSLCLLTVAITLAKSIRPERAALTTLIIFYLAVGLAVVWQSF